jgi:hypothetical protein
MIEHSGDYRIEAGGNPGMRVHWRLAATKSVGATGVDQAGRRSLVERDTRSSMVTTRTVDPADTGVTTARVHQPARPGCVAGIGTTESAPATAGRTVRGRRELRVWRTNTLSGGGR